MNDVRVLAFRLNGDGTETLLDPEVPLSNPSLEPVLRAGSTIEGTIEVPYLAQIGPDGNPIIQAWSTALYVEIDGEIAGGGIVTEDSFDWQTRTLSTIGFADYPAGQPFTSSWVSTSLDQAKARTKAYPTASAQLAARFVLLDNTYDDLAAAMPPVGSAGYPAAAQKLANAKKARDDQQRKMMALEEQNTRDMSTLAQWDLPECPSFTDGLQGVDPADIFRFIWRHLQSQPRGNLGVVVDTTATPVRIGKSIAATEYDDDNDGDTPEFEYGEYRLAWYETTDLGEKIAELAENTPFDFWEEHSWNESRTQVQHHIRIAYPRAGARRKDMRFELDVNVEIPGESNAGVSEYADSVLALGAGEGGTDVTDNASGRLHAVIQRDGETRIRRCTVLDDPSRATVATLTAAARTELAGRSAGYVISELQSIPGHDEDLRALRIGDEVVVVGSTGWREIADWYKITAITHSPDEASAMSFTVEIAR